MSTKSKGYGTLPPPVGKTINRSHSLAQGLLFVVPINEGGGLQAMEYSSNTSGTSAAAYSRTSRGNATTIGTGRITFPTGFPRNIGTTVTSPFTVSCWIYRNNNNNSNLFGWGSAFGWYCNANAVGIGTLNFDYYNGGYTRAALAAGTIATNTWYHIVCVRDGLNSTTSNKIYVNGVDMTVASNSSSPTTFNTAVQTFSIASRGSAGGIFGGNINNFMMWNRALTINEIKTLYRNPYCMYK